MSKYPNLSAHRQTVTLATARQCQNRACFVHEGETCKDGHRMYREDCPNYHRERATPTR